MEKHFSTLPPDVAEILRLCMVEGYTTSEVAVMRHCSRRNVRRQLEQGCARLREVVRRDECIW